MIWVKICGNTNLEDAQCAVEAGADALGFVFAESPRRVQARQVAGITQHIAGSVEKIGVFVDADVAEMVETVQECGLTGVQLHSSDYAGSARVAAALRQELRAMADGLRIIQVLHHSDSGQFNMHLSAMAQNDAIDALLIDSRSTTAVGGTGISFEWRPAQEGLARIAPHMRIIVAGGLTSENVGGAISTLNPWGVDVVTGGESAPGKKDHAKVRAFIAAARAGTAKWDVAAVPVQA